MEGEAKWQAAAQVRLLLTAAANAPNAIQTEALFTDPDVRWLAGIHESSGVTYFNKEQFEELATWLQLPALIELANSDDESTRSARIVQIESAIATSYGAAQAAGYKLKPYLAAFEATTAKSASR